jgi:hypothetical protein
MPINPGRVTWYVTGRFYEDSEQRLQDLGYFLHLEGVAGKLFDGPPGEASALLTFRSEPFKAQEITNGTIAIGLDATGDFSVYLRAKGGASFQNPDSFSEGTRVGVFRRRSLVMGETVSSPVLGGFAIAMNVFSADLIESAPFELAGVRYDLRELLPSGITQWGTMSASPLAVFPPYTRITAFTGSATAMG